MDGTANIIAQRVAVLVGGDSAERDISLASGQQVAVALALAGYEPVLIDPAEIELASVDWPAFDVCFIALHGGAGEDGRVQKLLQHWGVPYTGSGPTASRLAMNKSAAKQRFLKCGVLTLPFIGFEASQFPREAAGWPGLDRREAPVTANRGFGCASSPGHPNLLESLNVLVDELNPLGYPLLIKPESQGSSLGVTIANGPNDVRRCVQMASEFDSGLIAEPLVAGREFTVSLLGREPLPMIEIVSPQPVFTYDAKYSSATTEYRFEFALPATVERQLYDAAIQAAESLGTTGLVRVDLMLDRQQRPWVLEVNTIPGMTSRSLAPRAAHAAGIDMPTLVDWMVREAVQRNRLSSPGVATPGLAGAST
jgi:D-alanine-D-alanine ligase